MQTAHAFSHHDQVIIIPAFKIFNTKQNIKLHIFNFSDKYDGLLGADLLEQLCATVDFNNKSLTIPDVQIPIVYEHQQNNKPINQNLYHQEIIPPRTQKLVRIPVDLKNGTGILNYKKF